MEAKPDFPESHLVGTVLDKPRFWPSWRSIIPWVVLGVCLFGTWQAWTLARDQAHARSSDRFRIRAEHIREDIRNRMLAYDQVLKGAAGLYAASDSVEPREWRAYVLGLGIEGHYPGIHGLGFIAYIPQAGLSNFMTLVTKDPRPGLSYPAASFHIHPEGRRNEYFVVKYVEPIERNLPALGYDIGIEPTRHIAAERARDSGDVELTGRLRLVQSATNTPGVLLLRPIYKNGMSTNDTAQRRQAIEGWVFGAFQMNELMDQAFREDPTDVDFEIYDEGDGPGPATLLYDRDRVPQAKQEAFRNGFATNDSLRFANRTWELYFRTRPNFTTGETWNKPQFVIIAGIAMSLLLFGITFALAYTHKRAWDLAQNITQAIQVQERALSSSSNSITILDASQPGLAIVYANPAVEQMTGFPASELIGQDGSILLGPERQQPGVFELREAILAGRECRTVLHCYRKDGTSFWNEINLSPVRTRNGNVSHFVSVSTDITGRIETERHLEAARASAESASRAKSEFLANMSHEIRTPLNAVLGLTELVLDAPLNQEQRRLLSAAHQSANELAALVNDVLDFSRIEAGKLELRPEAFRLRPMLERCVAAFAPRAQEKGLALNLRVAKLLPDILIADVVRLRQVLLNLISNAVKFTARGEITLEVRESGMPVQEPASADSPQSEQGVQLPLPLASQAASQSPNPESRIEIEFIVTDTGIGIPAAKHQAIFEAFTQADSSITRLYGGTGLGLAISKRLVSLLGGRLWIESEVGRGSAFHFTARAIVASEDVVLPPEPGSMQSTPGFHSSRCLRVLVVEDNRVNAQLVTAFLEQLGHTVTQAFNGHDAVAVALRGEADLVLMDLQMPELDGLQASARIRDHERIHGGHLPIIALTAHALPSDRDQCLAGGMNDYLAKPVQRADLFATIERMFANIPAPQGTGTAAGHSPLGERLLRELEGDARALGRLVALFLENTPPLVAELKAAAGLRDVTRLARAAHTLKGSVMQMGGDRSRTAALAVERPANAGDLEAALAAVPALEQEVTRLTEELRRIVVPSS